MTRRLSRADREMAATILDIVASHPVKITTTDVADELDDVSHEARDAAYNAWVATIESVDSAIMSRPGWAMGLTSRDVDNIVRMSYAEAAQRLREQGGAE